MQYIKYNKFHLARFCKFSPNFIKLQMDGKDEIHHVCRCTAWIVVYRDAMYGSSNAIPFVKDMVLIEKVAMHHSSDG
jgi:hypothetical protein